MVNKQHEIIQSPSLFVKPMGINTYQESVAYMRDDCHVCRAEGFDAQSRVLIKTKNHSIIATLNIVTDSLLETGYIGLSQAAWRLLNAKTQTEAWVSHAEAVESLTHVRGKIFGQLLNEQAFSDIIGDIYAGRYADVHLASFITACAGGHLNTEEIISLTKSMVSVGDRLEWPEKVVLDKHCVGGLAGNRTTPIVVAIVSACGGTIPKTSSRAITSPSGTADTVETLMPVTLSMDEMRNVVNEHGGCMVWGGAVSLSPTDDDLIRVERSLDIDSEGQMVASVLSKKLAAGATDVLLDLPVGPSAKIRNHETAKRLSQRLTTVGMAIGLKVKTVISDGTQPVGRGIGPALEAKDVLAVLQNDVTAPQDLRERALTLAGTLLEMGLLAEEGQGHALALMTLSNGKAWDQFQAIAKAQGGLRTPADAKYSHVVKSISAGLVKEIDNRLLSRLAKLAGAPSAKTAGISLHVKLRDRIKQNQALLTVHAETPGELSYALDFLRHHPEIIAIREDLK